MSGAICGSAFVLCSARVQAVDYVRIAAGGDFRIPQLWQPFQVPPLPILFGPGGSEDTANFNLGRTPATRYTITNVHGINDQLYVHNDSLALEISDEYNAPWNSTGAPGITVGVADGDVADLVLSGMNNSTLVTGGFLLGRDAGSSGVATITGTNWHWDAGTVMVGQRGTGALTLENGATVSGDRVWIGDIDGTGYFTVRGVGSHWVNQDEFYVGDQSAGSLTIEEGGAITTNFGAVGWSTTASGTVVINGIDSSWTNHVELEVGSKGTGAITVENGGSLIAANSWLATVPGSSGTVEVRGAGSEWSGNERLYVGYRGNGTLTIEEGGKVASESGTVAFGPMSVGTATISGANSSWDISGSLEIGGSSIFGEGGTGTLQIDPLGAVNVADEVVLFPDGLVHLNGGLLTADAIGFEYGGVFDWSTGRLQVDAFAGDLVNQQGTLAPRSTTTVQGDYTQKTDATLEIEIAGLTQGKRFDYLHVTDDFQLSGSELDVILNNGFTLEKNQQFEIVDVGGDRHGEFTGFGEGGLVGTFDDVNLYITYQAGNGNDIALYTIDVAGDYNADGIVDAADYTILQDNFGAPPGTLPNDTDWGFIGAAQYETWRANYGSTSTAAAVAVPEPASAQLIFCAVAGLFLRRQFD